MCVFVCDYASVCSLIQVRPCVVGVCVTLLVIMLHCCVCSLKQVCPCVVSVCVPLLVIMLLCIH